MDKRLRELFKQVTPTVEFYLKREIDAPANHQEFAREAQEKLDKWHELEAAIAAPAEPQARIYPLNPPPRYDEEYVNAINKLDEIEHGAAPSEPQASEPVLLE